VNDSSTVRPALRGVRQGGPDATALFALEGYDFISRQCEHAGGDIAEVRLLGRPTMLLRGRAAARLVYDSTLFQREGAMPARVQRTLTGQGGVQGLDDAGHFRRKALFMSLLTAEAAGDVAGRFAQVWRSRMPLGSSRAQVTLGDEVGEMLCAAVSSWVGLPVAGASLTARTRDLEALIDSAGRVGPGHWRGVQARRRAEKGLGRVVEQVRAGAEWVDRSSALHAISTYREGGELLAPRVAAVELLNILRPTVAIGRYVLFAAHALHEHPQWRERLRGGSEGDLERFVHEVRRFYPFFPAVGAVTRQRVQVAGCEIPPGRRVLLDLDGTNRHPIEVEHAERFDPDRFAGPPGELDLIPQGGGDHLTGHRCAGEAVTIAVMKAAVAILVDELDYRMPDQDLSISRTRIPAAPASGMVLEDVHRR
jgi:fatty-acid peroxygenase